MNLTLKVWRQQDAKAAGKFVTYQVQNVTPDMSFLEMLDLLNENLQTAGKERRWFDRLSSHPPTSQAVPSPIGWVPIIGGEGLGVRVGSPFNDLTDLTI